METKYKEELKKIKETMEKAEKFAKKIPKLADIILDKKITGEEDFIDFGKKYKDMYFGWGIKRYKVESGTSRNITNYNKKHNMKIFNLYINSYSLFDIHDKFGLDKILDNCDVFFYDKLNSNFYATDEQIGELLEQIVIWYNNALKELKILREQEKIQKAKGELKSAKENLAKLTS